MKPPKSRAHVWAVIGALCPTDLEASEVIEAAYKIHAEELKIKWGIK